MCGVEMWRGGLGGTYRLPTLSVAGASVVPPCVRFHTPLIEPDERISRFKCSQPHLMRNVARSKMWPSAFKLLILNSLALSLAT
jgi:hypothetical protein